MIRRRKRRRWLAWRTPRGWPMARTCSRNRRRWSNAMSPGTKALLERVESWPVEDQEELAELAREIESRRTGLYRLSDEERAAVRAGLDDARQGKFVTDEEMEEFYQLHRRV